jgi:putative ABC transport system ATP-binding protein
MLQQSGFKMSILEVQEVTKTYTMGKMLVPALRGVTFEVKEGELIAIFGPSGSGKSTLLHVVGGLDPPDKGVVLVDGVDLYKLGSNEIADTRLKKIGFVFQFFNLLPRLSALKNVELPLALANIPPKKAEQKAIEMLSLVGLKDRINHKPTELSGGEQQRVAIARALINNPEIILADEPTGNLDTRTGQDIVELMKRLNQEQGKTFIIVTHDPQVAQTADRIIYLKDGRISDIKKGSEFS